MKKIAFIGAMSVLLVGSTSQFPIQSATANSRCHKLDDDAGIQGAIAPDGCTSPVGLCTAGVFVGDGLLNGTTSLTADGLAVAAGMPGVEAPTTLSYTALLTITTRRGKLITRDTGIFDTAGTGLFASRDVVVGGTGIFEGATGHIFYTGTGVTKFDAHASGEICLQH
jgi:hypothetical protein